MGGDHHGEDSYKVPDWKIYRVEDSPELMNVRKALASIGLKDPWLRNEVWKYTEFRHMTLTKFPWLCMRKGFMLGLGAAVVTTIIEKAFFEHDHGHDHGHDHH